MKNLKFKSGIVEVYETKNEMFQVLSAYLGKEEVEWALNKDDRFKDSLEPSTTKSHYIKKVVKIKTHDNSKESLMCLEHRNRMYEYTTDEKEINVNINIYRSGFACTTFSRPNKDLQKCFLEYYDTVRDDDRIEKILGTFKVGDKLYFINNDKRHLSSETINYIGLDCADEFVVEVGTNERENMFAIVSLKSDNRCGTYDCGKYLFASLEDAKASLLEILEKKKDEYKQKISDTTKDILEAMSFVG